MSAPDDASRSGLHDGRLVSLLDPVVEVLRGGLPYSDAAAALPDEQPIPSLRVRRRLEGEGLRVAIDRHRDDERVGGDVLQVDRLPLDRAIATPRRRVAPMPTTVLHLTGATPTDGPVAPASGSDPRPASASASEAASTSEPALPQGDRRLSLPAPGPGPQDVAAVLAAARRHRMVVFDGPTTGDPVLLAALVLQIVGAGTTVWCPPELVSRLELLGPELRALLTFPRDEVADDDLHLASRIARQKRAAWVEHDLRLAWQPDTRGVWVPAFRSVPWPSVSVVLVSRRPHAVPTALAMIAAQRGVDLEVVVALHGGGDVSVVDAERRRLGLEGSVVSVPETVPFGAVLDHAIGRSSAPTVLKWDDDDLYGPRHVQDLLVARRQTGAPLVGKAAEFVYLDGIGQTVWRTAGRAEADSLGIAGGTFLTDRAVLDQIGGYPHVARAVDHHLKVRLRDLGTPPFRTHGFGFVLRRHAQGHTWDAEDDRFVAKALRTFDGLPDLLELGEAARATALPAG